MFEEVLNSDEQIELYNQFNSALEAIEFYCNSINRPSAVFKPTLKLHIDGQWSATYGDLVAFGDNPTKAMDMFDELFGDYPI